MAGFMNDFMQTDEDNRVLQLGKFWPVIGGVEKVEYEFATGLSAVGQPCDMLAAACQGAGGETMIGEHARLITCRTWRKIAATMIAPSMISELRRRCCQYKLIHIHHPDPMAALALWLSGYKGPVVLHWHSDIAKQKCLLRFYMPLQRWLLRRASLILGTTPVYVAESPHLVAVRSKLEYLPIGIEPIVPEPQAVEKLRRHYQGRKIVFTLGRLVAYKGFEYLVEAARYLDSGYVILIGGSGPLASRLRQAIDKHGVSDRVELLGRVSDADLPAYYGACSLFCLSSVQKTEAFGIVQIEAMSCGKPVVATRIPESGVSWVNAHGVSGLNVVPRDACELARAIRKIADHPETYQVYCRGARRRYEEMFTKDKMINDLLEIYHRLWKTK